MKKIIYIITFILSLSLVLSINIETDSSSYLSNNDIVKIEINNCESTSFLKIINSNGDSITSKQGFNDWIYEYNTNSDPSEGDYKISASCLNSKDVIDSSFCVGKNCSKSDNFIIKFLKMIIPFWD